MFLYEKRRAAKVCKPVQEESEIASAERRVKPLARLLRWRYGPAGDSAPQLRLKAAGMTERFPFGPSTARSLTTRPIHPLSPREQRRPLRVTAAPDRARSSCGPAGRLALVRFPEARRGEPLRCRGVPTR